MADQVTIVYWRDPHCLDGDVELCVVPLCGFLDQKVAQNFCEIVDPEDRYVEGFSMCDIPIYKDDAVQAISDLYSTIKEVTDGKFPAEEEFDDL